jgi:tetratricopeptide (TPR) repeat protein
MRVKTGFLWPNLVPALLVALQAGPTSALGQIPLDSAQAVDSAARLTHQASDAFREGSRAGLQRAVDLWAQAAAVLRVTRARAGEGAALDSIGMGYQLLDQPDSAFTYYRKALLITRELRDRAGEGSALSHIGEVYQTRGRSDSAFAYLRQALAIRRETGDRAGEGNTLSDIGEAYQALGRKDSAFACYKAALAIAREVGNRKGEGAGLNNIGLLYSDLGRPDSALAYLRQALVTKRAVGDRRGEGITIGNLGIVYSNVGPPDSALAYDRQAVVIAREVGNRTGESSALNNLGLLYQDLGHLDSALTYLRQALFIKREAGDRESEGVTLGNIGIVYASLGLPDSALVYFRQALVLKREVGDKWGEASTLNSIGEVHRNVGRPDSALISYHQALAIDREAGARQEEGAALNDIGLLYSSLGRPDSALSYARQALVIVREVGQRAWEGVELNNIGISYRALAQPDSALAYYRQSLVVLREMGDHATEGKALNNIGVVYRDLGQLDSAVAYLRQGLMVRRQVGDRQGEGVSDGNIGRIYARLGRPDSALVYYAQALALARVVRNRAWEGLTLYWLGALHQTLRVPDLKRATAYFDSAAAVKATLGSHVGGDPNRVSLAEQDFSLFEAWTLAWLARESEVGREPAALAALAATERGKSKALLDLMRGSSSTTPPGSDLVAEGRQLVTTARAKGAGILVYLVTEDTLLTWIAPPGGPVAIIRTPISRDSLARLVGEWRTRLGADEPAARERLLVSRGSAPLEDIAPTEARAIGGSRVGAAGSAARALSKVLLPPNFSRRVWGSHDLVIVPQGSLASVPFAALPLESTGTPLGVRFAVRYAPSLASLSEAERRPRRSMTPRELRQALVVADPVTPSVTTAGGTRVKLTSLPGAAAEGKWVADYIGSPFLTGAEATQVTVEERLGRASIIHLATHGFAYSSESMARQSFVALAPGGGKDGLLTVSEVLDNPSLSLSAELVVLSACQTGLGNLKQAEGTVGLQRAFLARGARSILVSLWSVSDTATTILMRDFYTHWLGDRDHPTKAEALRRAQIALRSDPAFKDPLYWAAFQLVGAR